MSANAPNRFFKVFLIIFLLTPSLIVQASVTDLEISPSTPTKGDKVSLLLKAQPGESVDVSISFTKTVSVSDGKFEWRQDDVNIPTTANSFSVKATDVKTLHVSTIIIVPVTLSDTASGGEAEISQSNIPKGTYNIKIHGNAVPDASQITLQVKATTTITVESNGEYTYNYNTKSIPAGTFNVKVGGITRTVTLKAKGSQPPPVITDITPPTISDPTPTDTINITHPCISVNYSDDSGINIDSLNLVHNGEDVTDLASVTQSSLKYTSDELENGTSNHIEIWVSDNFSNEAYYEWIFTILIPPRNADIIITHLALLTNYAYVGQDVVVTVGVSNVGDLKGSYNLTLYLNDTQYPENLVSLLGGASATYNFTFTGLDEGLYHVLAGNLSEDFRIKSWTEEMNRSIFLNELTSVSPEAAAELVEALPPSLTLDLLNEINAETSFNIFEALNSYTAIDILETAIITNNLNVASSLLLGIRENSSATLLLEIEPQSGAQLLDTISKTDFAACAKRIENAIKLNLHKSAELLELIDANLLSEILYEIVWLPSTPSTVSDLFTVMNNDKVFEIIYLWFNQGYLDTIELVFNGLPPSKLETIIEPLTETERLDLLPHLSQYTIAKIESGLLNFPDLTIRSFKTSLLAPMKYSVKATVENLGNAASASFSIDISINGEIIDTHRADKLQFEDILDVDFIWEPEIHGEHHLKIIVDSVDDVIEFDETNNLIQLTFNIDKPELPNAPADYTYIILLAVVLGIAILLYHKKFSIWLRARNLTPPFFAHTKEYRAPARC